MNQSITKMSTTTAFNTLPEVITAVVTNTKPYSKVSTYKKIINLH